MLHKRQENEQNCSHTHMRESFTFVRKNVTIIQKLKYQNYKSPNISKVDKTKSNIFKCLNNNYRKKTQKNKKNLNLTLKAAVTTTTTTETGAQTTARATHRVAAARTRTDTAVVAIIATIIVTINNSSSKCP